MLCRSWCYVGVMVLCRGHGVMKVSWCYVGVMVLCRGHGVM